MSDTFPYLGVTYTIVYVDATAGGNNDGSTPTDALTTLPAPSAMTQNTCYLMRRTAVAQTWTPSTCNANNVMVAGCPALGDALFDLMPVAVKAGPWYNESPTYATILFNSDNSSVVFTGTDIRFHRIEYYRPNTGGDYRGGTLVLNGDRPWMSYCYGHLQGIDYDTTLVGSLPTGNPHYPLQVSNNWPTLENCEFQAEHYAPIQFVANTFVYDLEVRNCVFSWWEGYGYSGTWLFGGYQGSDAGVTSLQLWGYQISDSTFNCKSTPNYLSGGLLYLNAYNLSYGGGGSLVRCTYNFNQSDYTGGTYTSPNSSACYAGGFVLFDTCIFNINFFTRNQTHNLFFNQAQQQLFRWKDCTITAAVTHPGNSTGRCHIVDGNINGAAACSAVNSSFTCDGAFAGSSSNVNPYEIATLWLESCIVNCAFWTRYQFHTVTMNSPKMNPLVVALSGLAYIENLTVGPTNKTVTLYDAGMAFINNCNDYLTVTHNTELSAYYCQNEGGVPGRWHANSMYNDITTNTAYRSGGAKTYSLKGTSTGVTPRGTLLWIAPKPFAGIPVAFATTGRKKISVYFAYKIFTTFDFRNIQVEVEYLSAVSGLTKTSASSRANGQIVPDSSTWLNDAGLTVMRVDVFFTLPQVSSVEVRIGFQNYTIGGAYVLIDPVPVGFDAPDG